MKNSIKRWFKLLILIVLLPFLQSQQIRGPYSFSNPSANNIKNPNKMEFGSKSQSFVSATGGVSFDQVAKPSAGLAINSLKINYVPTNEDGKRLELTINSQKINVDLYDWQLVPIAKYSASAYYSCYTLFGHLANKNLEKTILDNGGRVMNYHPDLQNTLLGLRLSDLDVLIVYNYVTDLPKDNSGYILGKGEVAPNVTENQIAQNDMSDIITGIQSKYQQTHRSYVITDYTRELAFDFQNNNLNISGTPFYFCWRYKQDQSGYNMELFKSNLNTAYQHVIDDKKKIDPNYDFQGLWIDSALQTAKRYDGRYNLFESGTFLDLVNIKTGDQDRKAFLQQYSASSILTMILQVEGYMDAMSVDYLENYSKELSGNINNLRAISPSVWDAATNTMRYAAFFRYVKTNFADEWNTFINQISDVKVLPEVLTPTILYSTGNQAVESILSTLQVSSPEITKQCIDFMTINCFPNPFKESTQIKFSLADNAPVSLNVYDLKGKMICNLYSGNLPKGEHQFFWNGLNSTNQSVVQGVYLIQISSGKYSFTKKVLLVRN